MFKISESANQNYICQIVKIGITEPVPNSDNLLMTSVQGNIVVINKTIKEGDMMIYFPVECQIQDWYLKQNNLYSSKELNSDPTKKGFIGNNGRVRCIKLRNQPSQGLLMPISSLGEGFNHDLKMQIGKEFDTFNGKLLVKKYIIKSIDISKTNLKGVKKTKEKEFSKVIENQFNYHINTPQLGKNIHNINPKDIVSITRKLHGTSGISSYVLCKQPVSLSQKIVININNKVFHPIIKFFGGKIGICESVDIDYDYLYSSRKVIKNDRIKANKGFYGVDVWGYAHEVVKPALKKGMTMYYEIVGYLPSGKGIQGDYDYGCVLPSVNEDYTVGKHFKVFVYRITMTNPDGFVTEYTAKQVQEYCFQNMLTPVPEVFYGSIDSLYYQKPDMNDDQWRDALLSVLREKYLEKDCDLCFNNVPDEGVVIRKEGLDLSVFKFKSFRFLQKETEELDKGIENIEDN